MKVRGEMPLRLLCLLCIHPLCTEQAAAMKCIDFRRTSILVSVNRQSRSARLKSRYQGGVAEYQLSAFDVRTCAI